MGFDTTEINLVFLVTYLEAVWSVVYNPYLSPDPSTAGDLSSVYAN